MKSTLFALLLLPAFAQAAPLATHQGDFDGDSLPDTATLTRQPDSEWLKLEVKLGSGERIESRQLVRRQREASLSSSPFGLIVNSIEGQSSHAKSFDYVISFSDKKAELTIFDFHFDYPTGSGYCRLTPASGMADVNGVSHDLEAKNHPLASASGEELEEICHQLLIRR